MADRFEEIRLAWLDAKRRRDKAAMRFWWDEMTKIMSYADTKEFFGGEGLIMAIDLAKMATRTETLRCPRCDGDYLHHYEVASYFRKAEDSDTMLVTKASSGGTHVGNGGSMGNPSARRDGVVIHFNCEGCNASMYLEIAQHKGQTFVSWMQGEKRS